MNLHLFFDVVQKTKGDLTLETLLLVLDALLILKLLSQ
jgi:hypothetical protein